MKIRLPFAMLAALAAASPVLAAQQDLSTITTQQSRQNLRGAINTELGKAQSNFDELYDSLASQSAFSTTWGWTPGGVSAWSDIQALISGSGDYIKYDGTRGTPAGTAYTAGTGISIDGGVISSTVALSDLWDLDYNDLINAPTGGSMTWPSVAGIPYWTSGTAWAGAYAVGTAANNLIQLNNSGELPFAISYTHLLDKPTIPADVSDLTDTGNLLGGGGASELDDLTDVTISGTPTTGQILKFNGTVWAPGSDATAEGAGYVSTPPTYSDEACTAGQYALSESYRFDCVASGNWNRTALTDWSNPTPDTTPASFSFVDQTDVATSTEITSAPVQITGINAATAVSASGGTAGICTSTDIGDCGTFGTSPGNITNEQYVRARHTSSASAETAVNTVVTVGGVSDTFTSTTAAGTTSCSGSIGNAATTDAGYVGTSASRVYLRKITIDCSGTPSINFRGRYFSSDTSEVVFVVYTDAGGAPDERLYYSSPMYNANWGVIGNISSGSIGQSLSAGTYWVGMMSEGNSRVYYSSDTGGDAWIATTGAGTFPTPESDLTGIGGSSTNDLEIWLEF